MRPAELFGKRLLGLFSWHHKWKGEHQARVLNALQAGLEEIGPDHICITGDLTFTTHPAEVDAAAEWLEALAEPQRISLVPGNHDAFVRGALTYVHERWAPWMLDDEAGRQQFPYLQRRGPVDIIGLSSAVETPPAITWGRVGTEQLKRARALLERISSDRRPRLLLIHHPPQDGATRRSKALSDRKALQSLLADLPVDLILHGHLHRPVRASIESKSGPIPVLGASSGSAIGRRYSSAHFHVLDIDDAGSGCAIGVRHSRYDPNRERFVLGERETL